LTLLEIASCAHGRSSNTFKTSRPSDEALDLLSRGLTDTGYRVSHIDRQAGTVTTYWRDTGRPAPALVPGNLPATVFVRYTARWLPDYQDGHRVELRGERQRCAAGANAVTSDEVLGVCAALADGAAEGKASTDALAEHLSRVLTAPADQLQAALDTEANQ
jgi:hypothetical protein